MKRRTEITIEIDRVTVITRRESNQAWCAACGAEVSHLTAPEAAALSATDVQTIFRHAASGALHSSLTQRGALLICLTSLLHAPQNL